MKFLSDILAKAGLTVDGVVTLNNTATGQTPNANDNSTKLATTAWVRTFVQPYSLPIATSSVLGGIKVGTGLSIDAGTGVLSVSGGGSASIKSTQTFTATAAQTVFTISGGYSVGLIDVFLNGVYLSPNQTTATNGTTITLGDAAAAGDIIDVIIASPVYQGATTTTDQLSEGTTNLYFTNARARAAISESVTGLDYNSATGVLSITTGYGIPTTASQTTWDAAYNDKINSAAVTGTTTKTLTLTQQDGGTITASWTDDNTDAVTSVFGRTGAVVATSGDYTTAQVTEVTNLYYTDARARAAISVTGSGSYDSATGIITVTGGVTSVNTLTGAVTLTTTNIGEGTNLYYTTARANSDFDTRLATKSTTNLAEGTNLYYTTARANSDFDTRLATKSTTNLAEGTNLYYTDTRVGTYLTSNSYATQSYVSTQINNLVSGAPGLLDTLDELAAALGDDPNFATTVTTALGNRLRIDTASQGLTGTQQGYGRTNLGLGSLATLSSIGNSYITDLAWSKITGAPAFITSYTEVDTLATVTGRGASTSTAVTFSGGASISSLLINGATAWTEGSLAIGAHSADEGGQLVLNKATSYTYAAHIDVWHDVLRFLYGTNTATSGVAMSLNLSTKQLILPQYTTSSTFTGTAAGVLAFDSSGNILTIAVPGGAVSSVNAGTGVSVNQNTGAVTVSIGQSVATSASPTFDQVFTTNNGNGTNVKIGDDVWIGDVNAANTLGIKGQQDATAGYITFGSELSNKLGRTGTGALTWGGNTVYHAGNLTNLNQLTNGPGYLTSTLAASTYQTIITNPITGSGAGNSGEISYFTGATSIGGTSAFTWSSPTMTIGLSAASNQTDYKVLIQRHGTLANPGTWTDSVGLQIADYASDGPSVGFIATGLVSIELPRIATTDTYAGNAVAFRVATDNMTVLAVKGNGTVHLGQNGSSDSGDRLQVNGTGRFNGNLLVSTTSGSGLTITTNDVTTLRMTSSGGTKNWAFATTNLAASDFGIYQSNAGGGDPINAGSAKLYFNGLGAATFSSTVTASGITSTGTNTMLSASSSTAGLIVRGGSSIGTASLASGQILVGQTATYRLSLAYDDNTGYAYIDNLYDNANSNIYFRVRTNGTPINALTLFGTGAATFSSTISATKLLLTDGDPKITFTPSGYSGSYKSYLGTRSGAEGVLQLGNNGGNFIVAGNTGTGGALYFYVNATSDFIAGANGTLALSLASTGAATFASTISASNFSGTHSGSSSGTNTGDQNLSVLAPNAGSFGDANAITTGGFFAAFNPSNIPSGQSSGDWGVLSQPLWTSNSSGERYTLQFASNLDNNANIFVRKFRFNGSVLQSAWHTLLNSNNYSAYTGSGTSGRLSKWAANGVSLNDSVITDNGTNVRVSNPFLADSRFGVGTAGGDQNYASIFIGGAITNGTSQYALLCDPQLAGSSANYAIFANARIKANTAVASAFGVYIPSAEKLSGATITDNYALYIANQTSGSSTNYSIYSSGGLNYFGGAFSINNTLTIGAHQALTPSGFGYDTNSYKTLIVGHPGTNSYKSLAFGVDVSGNPSGSFSGWGQEYVWKNAASFITPNSGNNGYNTLLSWASNGQVTINNLVATSLTLGNSVVIGNWDSSTTLQFQSASNAVGRINFYDANNTEGVYIRNTGESYGGTIRFGARWDDDEDKIFFKLYQSSAGASYDARFGINVDPTTTFQVRSNGITAGTPSKGWPVYDAELDTQSRTFIFDTSGNNGIATAGQGATVALVLGQYYDSRVVITPQANGGASPGDQGTGHGKDMMIKGGTSDNGVGYKGGRLYLNGGMGYTSGGYNGNFGTVKIQTYGGVVNIGEITGETRRLNVAYSIGIRANLTGTEQEIIRMGNTGSGVNDGYLALLDSNNTKVLLGANASRSGDNFINNGGNFGINTDVPTNKLEVFSGSTTADALTLSFTTGADNRQTGIFFKGGPYPYARIVGGTSSYGPDQGFIAFYTNYNPSGAASTSGYCLERVRINPNGSIVATGDIIAYGTPSDARLKDIKEVIPNALTSILKLSGYRFDWKEVNHLTKIKEDMGVIAQEVEKVLPELARTNDDGTMSVRYQGLTAVLIEAMKEQQTQIESQKSEIEELKDLVKQLINR